MRGPTPIERWLVANVWWLVALAATEAAIFAFVLFSLNLS